MILPALLTLAPLLFAQGSSPVAGGVVSSKEWRVKRGETKEEEFIGDVRYRTGPTVIVSDWALYKHEPQTWQLRGGVKVDRKLDSGDLVEARGDRAFLDARTRAGWMTAADRIHFKRTPLEGEPDRARAQRMDWEGRERISLSGQVHSWGPRLESWSDRADYADATGELKLTGGRPAMRKFAGWDAQDDWTGALKADQVSAWQSKRRLSADGGVVGWLEFDKSKGFSK
jgi:hypothetical protein